jgi:leucyl aminopeptidase (aminopeptidase T)
MMRVSLSEAVLLAVVAGAWPSVAEPPAKVAPNYQEIAERIVGTSANVKEGEIVELRGGPEDLPFLEELQLACEVRGAFPFIRLYSESLARKWVARSLPKYDAKVNAARLGLAGLVNVTIAIPSVRDPSIWAGLPGERNVASARAYQPISELLLKRNVRQIDLDNGLAPSPSRAKELGISEAELASLYWSGLAADYSAVQAKGQAIKELLSKTGEVRITIPNGTDLKLKVKGRTVNVSDGVLSEAKLKAGGSALNLWMPAGEVLVTPVPGTAEGTLVDDRMLWLGKEILGVTATVKAGNITTITAKSGWEGIKSDWDAMGPKKNELSVIDFGINPAVPTGGRLETYMGAGNVSINTGGNDWAGGSNKEPIGIVFLLSGATVTLDGKPFITNGALLNPPWAGR